jgi:hypothetical protein
VKKRIIIAAIALFGVIAPAADAKHHTQLYKVQAALNKTMNGPCGAGWRYQCAQLLSHCDNRIDGSDIWVCYGAYDEWVFPKSHARRCYAYSGDHKLDDNAVGDTPIYMLGTTPIRYFDTCHGKLGPG